MHRRLTRLLFTVLLAAQFGGYAAWAQAKPAPAFSAVRGKLQAVTSDSLSIQTASGTVQVKVKKPLTVYQRVPSDLSHVTSNSYVGVTSVKQPDGTELAKGINIFPAELRGLGEGSFMLPAAPGATSQSRMTNASVSTPAKSRMTNATVQNSGPGKTLVLKYKEGSQTVSVPPNVEVNQIVPKPATLAVGDTVNAAAEKQPDGTLVTNKVYLIAAAAGSK
jgi:hypothetical protein